MLRGSLPETRLTALTFALAQHRLRCNASEPVVKPDDSSAHL